MKKLLRCRITLFLLAGWVVLSAIGFLGKDSVYKKYSHDVKKTPYFVLVLQGIHDGIYPWSGEETVFWEQPAGDLAAGEPEDSTEDPQGEQTPEDTEGTGEKEPDGTEGTGEKVPDGTEGTGEEGPGDPAGSDHQTNTGTDTEEPEIIPPREFVAVEQDYFDDALFIGDSRTVGLRDYGHIDNAAFFASVGLNVFDMWEEKFCEVEGEKLTLEEALSTLKFKKIYFQIGINEMGRGTVDTFMQAYSASVEKIRELQPEAIIYVQGIMRVGKKQSEKDKIFNNDGIGARNERIAQLADQRSIFYIDVNEVVCDAEGNLLYEMSNDQLHLKASRYSVWVDYLKTKGIEIEE